MKEWTTLAGRIQWALDHRKPTGDWPELGRACKVSRAAYHGWKHGHTMSLNAEKSALAAKFLQVSRDWLETGRGEPQRTDASAYEGIDANLLELLVPVRGSARLGDAGYYNPQPSEAGVDGYLKVLLTDLSPDDFAFQCFGSSMHPMIQHGWYMVIRPHGSFSRGDFVSCETTDGRFLIKYLGEQRDGWTTLLSVNEGQAPITLDRTEIAHLYLAEGPFPPSTYLPAPS